MNRFQTQTISHPRQAHAVSYTSPHPVSIHTFDVTEFVAFIRRESKRLGRTVASHCDIHRLPNGTGLVKYHAVSNPVLKSN